MPQGAEVVRFALQHGEAHIWAIVDPAAPLRLRHFSIIGTGMPMPPGDYVGTLEQGPFVWHLIEHK